MDRLIHQVQLSTKEMNLIINVLNGYPNHRIIQEKLEKALERAKEAEVKNKEETEEFAALLKRYFPQENVR
ncbi:hypothetical protein [Synechococcus sp. PCC 6312]|uniref:hypothetical protein n=1 Tax=Synechococcus sp. (strain ATCC 27167 / PCC 6312) TaxID=195253 RepID=UPI00029F0D19|nr:hypothetical protein [Synechococcus sp. PCC 6312]AFY61970.1 hypothetical protein Syn6312_2907 [Synechococcus sp. PCC 6312]